MFKMESTRDLRGRISYMFLYAPDQFPYEDFLSNENQMNLEFGFQQLRQGIEIALPNGKYPGIVWDKKRQNLHKLLDDAYRLYKMDGVENHDKARLILDDFDRIIFKKK